MRILLSALCCFLLSGCWLGPALYTEADARPGIAPGRYRVIVPDEGSKVMLVSFRADGMTRFKMEETPGDPSFGGFTPLDASAGTFIAWWAPPRSQGRLAYGLLRREAGGAYALLLPRCLETQAIVTAAGGTVDQPGTTGAICSFPDRASLAAAMRALAASNAVNGPVLRFEPAAR